MTRVSPWRKRSYGLPVLVAAREDALRSPWRKRSYGLPVLVAAREDALRVAPDCGRLAAR